MLEIRPPEGHIVARMNKPLTAGESLVPRSDPRAPQSEPPPPPRRRKRRGLFLRVLSGLLGAFFGILLLVGVIGGAAAFGGIGLIIGPVLLTLVSALLHFAEETLAKKS